MSIDDEKFGLRLPVGLRDRVLQAAEKSHRSMNATMVHYIERGLEGGETPSLRQHFAGLAMQGLLASGVSPLGGAGESIRDRAYALADLMVKGPQS